MNKSMKKIAAGLIGAVMALSAMPSAFAESFSDMPNDWRTDAIENAVANGLISGMGDGTVAPDANITRAQMAAIIVRALGATKATDISMFADVSADKWYYNELAKAVYMGAFSGDGQNMNPENNITFQECFTVLSRVFGLQYRNKDDRVVEKAQKKYNSAEAEVKKLSEAETKDEAAIAAAAAKRDKYKAEYDAAVNDKTSAQVLAEYSDGSAVAGWAVEYYGAVVKNGYWTGGPQKLLRPTDYITRGEFAVVMDNLVKTYISAPGTVAEVVPGNVVVRSSDVVLDGVTVKGDIIIGDGVEPNKLTLNNIDVSGRLVYRGCATPGEVEYETASGETAKKISYTEVGNSPKGKVFDVQLIAPYIYVDLGGLKYEKAYVEKDTCVNLGNVQ